MSGNRSDDLRGKAFDVIYECHPGLGNPAGVRVCGTCEDTLVCGKLPTFSTGNGYVYLLMSEGPPKLNAMDKRLLPHRLPFLSVHVSSVLGICSDELRGKAFDVIREYHLGLGNPIGIRAGGTRKDTLVCGKLPSFTTVSD
ncbi:hypothetical protein HPB52_016164 [Rhipicephalus sanguineus]|uniref:Uncharacterized protein n=1 Tax=Rhipicephalus sanguineus TaxID=34632 RepID=A0A9D4T5S2_RHISA|nr:hypothetical protein HPB52_016164 [Rhipicephalus sanguineus]